ncbi:isochorismatase family cysteine hydrolase [Kitasatospora purpeofusca]|uniref:isochorismatase family cysteine hydrolase n=1 Tax=Kitasatospora purpeofusca TaxID=67352 RepID=UPI0035D5486D
MRKWLSPNLDSTTLAVVDVQVGFVNEASTHVVPVIAELLSNWQARGRASVVITYTNPEGSPYETISGWTKLRTPAEQALVPELVPLADGSSARFTKSTSSAFEVNEIEDFFRSTGTTDLVICGLDTDSCVHDTAVGAYHRSITPWIVTNACASSGGADYHEIGLRLAGRNLGGRLVTSSDVLAWPSTLQEVSQ